MATSSELDGHALALKVSLEVSHEVELLREREAADDRLQNRAHGDVVLADEAAVVHVGEDAHEEPVG